MDALLVKFAKALGEAANALERQQQEIVALRTQIGVEKAALSAAEKIYLQKIASAAQIPDAIFAGLEAAICQGHDKAAAAALVNEFRADPSKLAAWTTQLVQRIFSAAPADGTPIKSASVTTLSGEGASRKKSPYDWDV